MTKLIKILLGKPNPWRLGFLLLILATCALALYNKQKTESALITNGTPLAQAIWQLSAYLPQGESDPALTSRVIRGQLPDGRYLTAEMDFTEAFSAWPTRLTLTYNTNQPDQTRLAITPPFDQPTVVLLFFQDKSRPGFTIEKITADLQALKTEIAQANPPLLEPFTWHEIGPGLDRATVQLRYGVRLGPREMYIVRIDPASYDFKPYHEQELNLAQDPHGLNITSWSRKLHQAKVLINGGQYYEDRSYIGLLRRDGHDLSAKPHRNWSGYLVSNPRTDAPEGAPLATVLDLETDNKLKPEHYSNVMQSLMLFDSQGTIRVNDSYYLASRAAIGQDQQGRIWFIMNHGAISLNDWATVLQDKSLGLNRALCLDGGFEAQIHWREKSNDPERSITAEYLVFPNETVYAKDIFRSLPSVIVAEPRPNRLQYDPLRP